MQDRPHTPSRRSFFAGAAAAGAAATAENVAGAGVYLGGWLCPVQWVSPLLRLLCLPVRCLSVVVVTTCLST